MQNISKGRLGAEALVRQWSLRVLFSEGGEKEEG